MWVNSKSFLVDHRHVIGAQSRGGIRECAWNLPDTTRVCLDGHVDATNRQVVRKRNITYLRPSVNNGDYIGRIQLSEIDIVESGLRGHFANCSNSERYRRNLLMNLALSILSLVGLFRNFRA